MNLSSSTILRPNGSSSFIKKRVLIVDDEVDITTVFKLGLEKADFVVDAYTDPVLALSEYKPDMYDLLLFDIKMPKMDGFELYKKLNI